MEATLAAIVAAAAPLVFASVGETLTERAGVVNLSLDGSILLAALTGFAAASTRGSVVVGLSTMNSLRTGPVIGRPFSVATGTSSTGRQSAVMP